MTPDRIAELERLLASLPPMTKAEREFADFLKDRLRQMKAAHEANPVPRKSKTFEEATDGDKEVGSGSIWERTF